MTPEQQEQVKTDLRRAGFGEVEYDSHNGQFNLRVLPVMDFHIKEANPMIGCYGTEYETMRRWADGKIDEFVKQQLPAWKLDRSKKRPPRNGAAIWFNLKPTTDLPKHWYERRAEVIEAAKKLFQKLEEEEIFADDFAPEKYAVNNAGNQKGNDMDDKELSPVEKEIKALLEANLNVILTGAPGTGKTFTAKKVAYMMTGDTKDTPEEESHIAFVQFHPGYDYSDFVIGMKPVLVSKGEIGGKEVFQDKKGQFYSTDNNKKDGQRTSYQGPTDVSYQWKDGIFKEFADKARDAYDKTEDKAKAPKFVFLIDEINRADLSRVFGELFSLLEEEYRYPDREKGITLPNGEEFVIPKNLYIIGTMNDIDRSVESMDFALRRRFAWFEVSAESSMEIIDEKVSNTDAAKKLRIAMDELNFEIAGKEIGRRKPTLELRLGSEYQLGGAIFAKFKKYAGHGDVFAFDKLWENHIENILKEYLRGRSDRGDLLEKLERDYREKVGITGGKEQGDEQASSDQGSENNGGQV